LVANPWLSIEISDYVNHMSSPEVGQYQLINECFKNMVEKYSPKKIFIPGCTIGNGFEHIKWEQMERVIALDINAEFLEILKRKFPDQNKLEILNMDFQNYQASKEKFNLIFVALFFEYIELAPALLKIKELMSDSSILFTIIQLPEENQSKVSKSKYKSLEKLNPYINLVSIEEYEKEIESAGLKLISKKSRTLLNGKSFYLTEALKS
jgi:Methyltransferase domain